MDEEFESLVVTDPDIIDEGIDVSGLRTQTDVSPFLLGNIPDYAGIQYEAFNPRRLSDLMRLYSSGLPAIDTPAAAVPPATGGGGSGDGGQTTLPITGDSTATPIIPIEPETFTAESLDQSFLGEEGPATQPLTSDPITIENIGPGREYTQPDGTVINIDPLEEQMLLEELRNEELGTDTFTPTLQPETTGGAPVVSQQLQDQGPTTIEGLLSQVQVPGVTQADLTQAAIDKERLGVYTPSFDTSGLTDATPEQRNTIQNILTSAGDNVQGALTQLGKIPGAIVDFANQTVDVFGKKINVGTTLAKLAINKIAGGPISLVFDVLGAILPKDTLEQSTSRNIVNELKAEKDYGFNMQAGNMNQDPFGRNPPAANYEQKLKDDLLGINQSGFQTAKFLEKKQEFAKDYFDKKAEYAGGVEQTSGISKKAGGTGIVKTGDVLGPGEVLPEGEDLITLDDMLREQRDERIGAGIQAADDDKGDDMLDTFDTTPATEFDTADFGMTTTGINPFEETAPTALELAAQDPNRVIFDERLGYVDAAGNPIQTTGDVEFAGSVEENVMKGYQRELDSLKGQKESIGDLDIDPDVKEKTIKDIDDAIKDLEETIEKLEEAIEPVTIEQTGLGGADDFDTAPITTTTPITTGGPPSVISRPTSTFDAEAEDEIFEAPTPTPTPRAPDFVTGGGGGRDRDPAPSAPKGPSGPPSVISRPTPSFTPRGGGADRDPAPTRSAPVSTAGQAGPPSQRGGGGGGGGGGDGCFLKGTQVTMADGSTKAIEQVDLGDNVAKGGKVFATGKFLVENLHDYKGIKVSGSHMVSEDGNWVRVEDSKHGKALGDDEHTVYVFGAENRRILINDILFTDYFEVNEQEKLSEGDKFFDNWKIHAKVDSDNNVNVLNAN